MYKGLKQPLDRSEGLYKRVMETILLAPFKQRTTHSDENIKMYINRKKIKKSLIPLQNQASHITHELSSMINSNSIDKSVIKLDLLKQLFNSLFTSTEKQAHSPYHFPVSSI